jgi:hypothetical protein
MRACALAAGVFLATAAPAAAVEYFPQEVAFRALVADPAEPRSFVSLLRARSGPERLTLSSVGFGANFGLARWPGARAGDAWDAGIFGAAFAQFNLSAPSDDLINSDFVVGVPLAFKRGGLAGRIRLWHQSSHLGDDLILGGGAPPRVDLSMEVVDAMLAWERRGWRLYGGGSYVVRRDERNLKRAGAQAGIDYEGGRALLAGGRLVAGLDVKGFEETDWDAGVSVKLGLQFGPPHPARRGLTLLLEGYHGLAPFGQFTSAEVRYYGLALQFDF